MAGFGGAVKLTGETEYRKAIEQITQDLGKMSSALSAQTKDFQSNDKSVKDTQKAQKDLTDSIKSQEQELGKAKTALAGYQTQLEAQKTKHNAINKEYKSAVAELEKIRKASGETSEEFKKQSQVVDKLGDELTDSNKEMEESKTAMSALKKEISASQKDITSAKTAMDDLGDQAEKSGDQAKEAGGKFSKLGDIAKGIGVALGASVVAIGAAVVASGKKIADMAVSVSSAGDEIDKQSQKLGLSAENYQALDYALQKSGASIDNISKGMININTTLANAENGVEGAGKQFDALGVSLKNADGSMRSSEEVLLDSINALSQMENETQRNAIAQKIFGKSAKELTPLLNSGADGISALMQEAKDYGIVMSDEAVSASATFDDSLTKMQGTITGLKNNMIGSLLPSLTMVTDGFSDLVAGNEGATESIKAGVSGMISNITEMIPNAVSLVSTLAQAVMETAPQIIRSLADGIIGAIPTLAPVAVDVITELVSTIVDMMPDIIDAGLEIIVSLIAGITNAIPQLVAMMPKVITNIVNTLTKNLPLIVKTGITLLTTLTNAIISAIPQLVAQLPQIITSIVNTLLANLPLIINAGVQLLTALVSNMPQIINGIVKALPTLITGLINGLMTNLPAIVDAGVQLLTALVSNMPLIISGVVKALPQIIQAIITGISGAIPQMAEVGSQLIQGLWNGISNVTGWILEKIKGFGQSVLNGIKSFFGIASPSKLMRDEIGANLAEGIGLGFSNQIGSVTRDMKDDLKRQEKDLMGSVDRITANMPDIRTPRRYRDSATDLSVPEDMVSAFKMALTQVKIELDDEVAGRFVDRTVTKLIYT